MSGTVAMDSAVERATPREARPPSQSKASDCIAVSAAQGIAVHRYTLLTTMGDRGVRRRSRISAGKISSRSAQESFADWFGEVTAYNPFKDGPAGLL